MINQKKEILTVTLKVIEEKYKNPKYDEQVEAQKIDSDIPPFDEYFESEFLKKTHFEVTGTIDGMNFNPQRLVRIMNRASEMSM